VGALHVSDALGRRAGIARGALIVRVSNDLVEVFGSCRVARRARRRGLQIDGFAWTALALNLLE
jgi:hypothetical protein